MKSNDTASFTKAKNTNNNEFKVKCLTKHERSMKFTVLCEHGKSLEQTDKQQA